MKISQVSVSQAATYFKTGLKERWGLSDYSDPNAPCLFFGVSDQVDLINKHKGHKLLYFIDKYDTYPANISSHNVICFANPYSKIPAHIKTKPGWFETRVNTILTPAPLGNKVFVYLRNPTYASFHGSNQIPILQKLINYEILPLSPSQPIPFSDVVDNYYRKCFVSVNFTETEGLTSVCDLGLIGIRTIMNTKIDLASLLKCNTFEEVPQLIKNESVKIGSIQPIINNYTINPHWQNIDFWLT